MMAGRRAGRGFKLPEFISINTAVATVCASSAGDRSSSAGVEEVENEKRNEGAAAGTIVRTSRKSNLSNRSMYASTSS